jgi:hypothetical protein
MSQTWTIMIQGNPTQFNPDVFGIKPGEPLKAQIGDLVSWNNQTASIYAIQVNAPGGGVSFGTKIDPFKSSSPGYVIQAADVDTKGASGELVGTIRYYSSPSGEGTITVVKS